MDLFNGDDLEIRSTQANSLVTALDDKNNSNILYLFLPAVCEKALGVESGAIKDAQITASSAYSSRHAAYNGRLNRKAGVTNSAGSWTARTSNANEWLQIDLGNHYTTVSGVATQGRNGYGQWVKQYKLQYSNDGTNFQYYREQGQSSDKVGAHFVSTELLPVDSPLPQAPSVKAVLFFGVWNNEMHLN